MNIRKSFFTFDEAASILECTDCFEGRGGNIPLSQTFRVDSRDVKPGDVFVALQGKRDDGHKYIKSAVEAGASAVILNNAFYEAHREELSGCGALCLPVRESEEGLIRLASAWLKQVSPKVAGITGSVGKTTARELLCGALRNKMKVHAAPKSYNTLIGCSMTILSMPFDTEVLILELGTSHPGEIAELVRAFPITHGVITEVAPAHLEGLKSLDGVLAAKMEIVNSDVLTFLSYNADNAALSSAVERVCVAKKGVGTIDADIKVSNVRQQISDSGVPKLEFLISADGEDFSCSSSVFGRHHAMNFGFAFALARELGMESGALKSAFADLELPSGRGRIYRAMKGGIVIDDSYNANPASLSAAIKNLAELECNMPRRVAVLGGMRELGESSDSLHRAVLRDAVESRKLDEIYLVGGEWASVPDSEVICGRWQSADDFIKETSIKSAAEGAVVLIKGSRYYGLERLLPILLDGEKQQ